MTPVDLDRLRALYEAATPVPWRECGRDRDGCQCGTVWSVPADSPIAKCNKEWGDGTQDTKDWYEYGSLMEGAREANAKLIADICSNAPALMDELESLRAANPEPGKLWVGPRLIDVPALLSEIESLRAEVDRLHDEGHEMLAAGRDEERAAIVAWLHDRHFVVAKAIERGDHHADQVPR